MNTRTEPSTPTSTPDPLQIAIKLELSLVPFSSAEWIGRNGEGYQIQMTRLYWMKGSYMHSGPFRTPDQALDFLYRWYERREDKEAREQEARDTPWKSSSI